MMRFDQIIALILVFALGFFAAQLLSSVSFVTGQTVSEEQLSPTDRISEDQIKVYDDVVVLEVKGVEWSSFTNTNSMDPFLDEGANALQFIPNSVDDIDIGDIISYVPQGKDDSFRIIHRVVYKGADENGTYFIVKGDNNRVADPGKVYFNQVRRVLFAVIW